MIVLFSLKVKYLIRLTNWQVAHSDLDHIGGAIALINNFDVENIVLNKGEYSEVETELINNCHKVNIIENVDKIKISNNYMYFLNNKIYNN